MADFPENGKNYEAAESVGRFIGYLFVGFTVVISLLCVWAMIHGVATRDLWEVISGFVGLFVLGILYRVIAALA